MRFADAVARGLKRFSFYGSEGMGSSGWLRMFAPGSSVDYARQAGVVYDNSVVSICLSQTAALHIEAPPVIQRRKQESGKTVWHDEPDHPLGALLANPNEWYGFEALMAATILSWNVDGNAYWFLDVDRLNNVKALYYIPHFQMSPMADKYNPDGKKLITYYEYRAPGQMPVEFAPEQILHFRNGIDPGNMRRGLSPLGAQIRHVVGDNLASAYSAGLLNNSGVPSLVLVPDTDTKEGPTVAQKQALRDSVQSFTGDDAGRVLVLPRKLDVKTIGFSPEQLALDKLASLPVSRICAALGADPMVFGLPSESKTYDNIGKATEGYYEKKIKPDHKSLGAQFTHQVLNRVLAETDLRLGWDYSGVAWLSEDEDRLWKRVTDSYARGAITRAQAQEALGYEAKPEDEIYVHDAALGTTSDQSKLKQAIGEKLKRRATDPKELEDNPNLDANI